LSKNKRGFLGGFPS